jgi:hypothetical protein
LAGAGRAHVNVHVRHVLGKDRQDHRREEHDSRPAGPAWPHCRLTKRSTTTESREHISCWIAMLLSQVQRHLRASPGAGADCFSSVWQSRVLNRAERSRTCRPKPLPFILFLFSEPTMNRQYRSITDSLLSLLFPCQRKRPNG